MRRRIRKVSIIVSEGFYRDLDNERNRIKNNLGLSKISFPDFTEMLNRSGVKIRMKERKRRKINII